MVGGGSDNAGFLFVLVGSHFGQRRGDNKNPGCGDKGSKWAKQACMGKASVYVCTG